MSRPQQEELTIEKGDVVQIDDERGLHELPAEDVANLSDLLEQARKATDSEHKMTVWQAVKRYPKASAWSIGISFGVIMEGKLPPSLPCSRRLLITLLL